MTVNKNKLGIYIHIPFCYKKCNYCDFYSKPEFGLVEDYVRAVIKNIKQKAQSISNISDYIVDTVFFGGGTPSSIDPKYINDILTAIKESFTLDQLTEITIEINPASADDYKLKLYHSFGINRLSIGLQSVNDVELKLLGRLHSYTDFLQTFDTARNNGFKNINVDLMCGIPGQSINSYKKSLEEIITLSPEHISSYMLSIEENTVFGKNSDKYVFPDEDIVAEMFDLTHSILSSNGYEHYEISNFAKKGKESRHNIKYWERADYLSFGPTAYSFFKNTEYSYPKDLNKYISSENYQRIEEDIHILSNDEILEERIIFGLRMIKGIDIDLLNGYDAQNKIQEFIQEGYLNISNGRITLTQKGRLVSNTVISYLIMKK